MAHGFIEHERMALHRETLRASQKFSDMRKGAARRKQIARRHKAVRAEREAEPTDKIDRGLALMQPPRKPCPSA
jgi:hypothetical protein